VGRVKPESIAAVAPVTYESSELSLTKSHFHLDFLK
jgi:hypothetical protein